MLRRSVPVLLLLGGLAAMAAAQPGGGPRALTDSTVIERRVADLAERLELSPEQTASVRTILYEQGAEARKAIDASGGDRESMRRAVRQGAQEADRRIEALLTDEQKEAYRVHREERRREMRQRFQKGERPRP